MVLGATAAVIGIFLVTRPTGDTTDPIHWVPIASGTIAPPSATAANPISGLAAAQPVLPPLPIVSARQSRDWRFPATFYRPVAGTDVVPLMSPSVYNRYRGIPPLLAYRP